jgi:CheY-like chemotaxis protein
MPNKILIIDDEPRNTIALSAILRARGYACITAPGAAEGKAILERDEDIGIILLDMMMPEIDGYQAVPQLQQVRSLPVIAVTAQAMVGDREKCLAAGAADYISKPIDVDKLMGILEQYLKKGL